MVSMLDFGSDSLGSSPGQGIALCSWARHLTLTAPLLTQVYKWVLANLLLGVTLQWTSSPSRGEHKFLKLLHATETGIRSVLMGHLARQQAFTLTTRPHSPPPSYNLL